MFLVPNITPMYRHTKSVIYVYCDILLVITTTYLLVPVYAVLSNAGNIIR